MRKLFLLTTLVALLSSAPSALAATKSVSITPTGFSPSTLALETGDTITFTNNDTRFRQPTSQDGGFTSDPLRPGELYTTPDFKSPATFTVTDALVANQRLTVTVTRATPGTTPSLTGSRLQVVYGGAVTLTGKLPTAGAGRQVTLRAETLTSAGTRQTASVARASTRADGSYSFQQIPPVLTTYTVFWNPTPAVTATSTGVTVSVAPRVTLSLIGKLSGRRVVLSTKVAAAVSLAGKSAYVQRRTAAGRWLSIKKVVLGAAATRTTVRLPQGLSRIRIMLPKSEAGTGYVAGLSRTLQIVR